MKNEIVLTMIVRNEALTIERCLESVRPFVSAYCIVDTGSTDGTQEIVKQLLEEDEAPAFLHERPWVNFGFNRSEAIVLARSQLWCGHCDYHLVIDADDVLEPAPDFVMPPLQADVYSLEIHDGPLTYWRPHIFRTDKPFRYEGVVHEYLDCSVACSGELLPGLGYRRIETGGRGVDRFERDVESIRDAMLTEPNNSRYQFYLAQSLRDAGRLEEALAEYLVRADMAGRKEETWLAMHEAACLKLRLGHEDSAIVEAFLRALVMRPKRIEPLFELARYFNQRQLFDVARGFAARGLDRPVPEGEQLFLDRSIYEKGIREEFERARAADRNE